jgi:hypothetical protein
MRINPQMRSEIAECSAILLLVSMFAREVKILFEVQVVLKIGAMDCRNVDT